MINNDYYIKGKTCYFDPPQVREIPIKEACPTDKFISSHNACQFLLPPSSPYKSCFDVRVAIILYSSSYKRPT